MELDNISEENMSHIYGCKSVGEGKENVEIYLDNSPR